MRLDVLHRPTRALAAPLLTLLSGLAGCQCGHKHPYVPFDVEAGPPPSQPSVLPASSEAAPAGSVDGGTFPRVAAQQAPAGSSTWSLGGLSVAAPPGRVFLLGLPLAPSQPGQPAQVAAFVGDGGSMAGEVVLYRAESDGRVVGPTTLAHLPAWMPTGQDCSHIPALSQIGPSTLWLDIASVCRRADQPRPNRYLAAISTQAAPAVRAELRVADPAPGERIAIEADGADRDGDGLEDLLLQLSLEGAPSPTLAATHAGATLRLWGRGSGLSRDPLEPAASLRTQASWQAAQASRPTGADHALSTARQLRRLFTLLCSEGGASAITLGDGAPIACGETGWLDDARYAEARAALTVGDLPGAFARGLALRDGKLRSKRTAEFDAAFEAKVPPRKVNARPLRVTPVASSVALPMAFEAAGTLLVQGDDGVVVRVDPANGDETTAAGAPRWNPRAELVSDLKVQDGADTCRTDFLRLHVSGASSGNRDLLVPVLGGTSPPCDAASPLPLSLLDRNADGLTVLLFGSPVSISSDGEKAQLAVWPAGAGGGGSARSPDGRWLSVGGPDRMLLRGPERAELWRPHPSFVFHGCTAANDGKAAACLLEHGLVLLTP